VLIHDAARYFDNDPVTDGYTGAVLFNAQTASFDDSNSDGATLRRRVLSLAPGLSIPTRRVISMYGDRWLVGTGTPDGFLGSVIRQHFGMKRVTDNMTLYTPNQAVALSGGTAVYAHKFYFRDVVNNLTEAEFDTFWNIFVAPGEAAAKGSFFRDADGRFYRVRNDYLPVEGLRVCQSDTLDAAARTTAVFNTGSYNPITDSVSAGTTTVNCIKLEPPKFYRFRYVSDPKLEPGDLCIFVPGSFAATTGQTFTMDGRKWRVLGVETELDAKALHVRLA